MKNLWFAVTICLLALTNTHAQTLWRVNNNPVADADYTTVQAAVDAASAGDTIYIEGSLTAYTGFTITKPLHIIGTGYFIGANPHAHAFPQPSTINGNVYLNEGSGGSVVCGLNMPNYSLYAGDSNLVVRRCYMSSIQILNNIPGTQTLIGLQFIQNYIGSSISDSDNADVVLRNNLITSLYLDNTGSSSVVTNNTFYYPWGAISTYNGLVSNNIFVLNSVTNPSGLSSYSNNAFKGTVVPSTLNVNNSTNSTLFATESNIFCLATAGSPCVSNSTDGQYILKTGASAIIGLGTGGEERGAFGGLTPYILSGYPAVPRITSATIPTTGSSANGLPVTIEIRSQN